MTRRRLGPALGPRASPAPPRGGRRPVHATTRAALAALALLSGACAQAPLAVALPLDGPLAVFLRLAEGDTVLDARVSLDPGAPERFTLDDETRAIVVAWWPADVALPDGDELDLTRTPTLLSNPTCDGETIAPDGRRRLPLSAMPRGAIIDVASPETAAPLDPARAEVLAGSFLAIDRREDRCRVLADETLRPFAHAFDAVPAGSTLRYGVVGDASTEQDAALERELELRTLLPIGDDVIVGVSVSAAMIFRRGEPFAPTPERYAPIADVRRVALAQAVAGAALRLTRSSTAAELLVAWRAGSSSSALDRLELSLVGPGAPAFTRATRTVYAERQVFAIAIDREGDVLLGHASGVDRVEGAGLVPLLAPPARVGAIVPLPSAEAPHLLVTYAGVVHVGDLGSGAFRAVQDLRVNAETSVDVRRVAVVPDASGAGVVGAVIGAIGGTNGRLYTRRSDASGYTSANVDLPIAYAPCTLSRDTCGHVRYAGELDVVELSSDGEALILGDGRCAALTVVRARDLCARVIAPPGEIADWPASTAFTASARVGRRLILGGRGARLAELDLTPR